MRMIFDFKCPTGHVTESLVDAAIFKAPCKICSETAARQISAPKAMLDGTSGHFPGAADKWARQHERGANPAGANSF